MKIRHFKFYEGVTQLGDLGSIFCVIPFLFTNWIIKVPPTSSFIAFWIPIIAAVLFIGVSFGNNRKYKKEHSNRLFHYDSQEGTGLTMKWDFMYMILSIAIFALIVSGFNQRWFIEYMNIFYIAFALLFYSFRDRMVQFNEELPIRSIQIFPDRLSLFQFIFQVDFALSEIKSLEVKEEKLLITTNQSTNHEFNLSDYGPYAIERFERRIEEVLAGKLDMQTGDLIINYS